MPEIIKCTCGSLRQMAGRGTELDLEPGRECRAPLFRLEREELWVEEGMVAADPVDLI